MDITYSRVGNWTSQCTHSLWSFFDRLFSAHNNSSVDLLKLAVTGKFRLRVLDTNFESLENFIILYIVKKVMAIVEFGNIDDVASCIHDFCHKKSSCKNCYR